VLGDAAVLDCVKNNGSVECRVSKGGVIAMRPLLIHSSSKSSNQAPRRVVHIEYSDSLELAPDIRLALA
jgi:hypothetical protein